MKQQIMTNDTTFSALTLRGAGPSRISLTLNEEIRF